MPEKQTYKESIKRRGKPRPGDVEWKAGLKTVSKALDRTLQEPAKQACSLKRVDERLETAVFSIDAGFALINRDMTVVRAGERFRDLCPDGKSGPALEWREAVAEAFADGERREREFVDPRDNRWYNVIAFPVKNDSGVVDNVFLAAIDVTERRSHEQRLRLSEEKHRIVADSSNDWEFWLKPDGLYAYVSPSCAKITGYPPEQLSSFSKTRSLLVHPEDLALYDAHVRDTEERKKSGEIEFRIVRQDGRTRWIRHSCGPLFGADGEYLGIRGSNRDVTFARNAERSVRKSEKKYRTVVENANAGIVVVQDRKQVFFNCVMYRKLGYTEDGYRDLSFLSAVHPEDRDWVAELLEKGMLEGHDDQAPALREFRLTNGSGRVEWVEGNFAAIQWGSKPAVQVFMNFITKRKQAEQERDQALKELESLKNRLKEENIYLRSEIREASFFSDIIGKSNAILYVLNRIGQVATTDAAVLIQGETGVGKELVSRAVHRNSRRSGRPFIKINCAALPGHLIESELFGHEQGAFTGALQKRKGRFELADGGTLFLDEVSEMPLEIQAKFLRVIDSGEFERVGGARTFKVDVRVIAASNRNLDREVAEGRFRADLFYRLNVYPISVPPLRKRREDIPVLVEHFIPRIASRIGKHIDRIPVEMMERLKSYDWPGNVRELKNVLERAIITGPDSVFRLPVALGPEQEARQEPEETVKNPSSLEDIERRHILNVLEATKWRISGPKGAAKLLELNPSTLRSRMKKLNIGRG